MTGENEPIRETDKQFELRVQAAERAHDARRTALNNVSSEVLSFSNSAKRSPALVAAGGVAAALGFCSANYTRLSAHPEALTTFNMVLYWLFASLLLTVMAPGLAYFAQACFAESLAAETYEWEQPFIRDTTASIRWSRAGAVFRWAAIFFVVGSMICLAIGGVAFLSLVR
ncbi:MAG: hypothetical protein E5V89_01885 [Mesorhizobium sp.]|nr:MAG: hypothetical protein E5V89_01885 [Mesorhizobium sp.]